MNIKIRKSLYGLICIISVPTLIFGMHKEITLTEHVVQPTHINLAIGSEQKFQTSLDLLSQEEKRSYWLFNLNYSCKAELRLYNVYYIF